MCEIRIEMTPQFARIAFKELSKDSLDRLVKALLEDPEVGSVISQTGGVRKMRWSTGKDNKGKRGGVRILYFYRRKTILILITLFKKNEKENLTAKEKIYFKKVIPELIKIYL